MDYYVTTTDGRIHHLEDITATPTVVTNDGVATSIFNGVYRDVFPFPNAELTRLLIIRMVLGGPL